MANMDTTGFLIELRRLKGLEIGEPTVRYHARAGRIGRKVDGLWVFTDDDIDAIMEYSGQRDPREKQFTIKPLEWIEEDTFVAFGSFGTFEVMESGDDQGSWIGSLNDANGYDGYEEMDFQTVEEAKKYCEELHEKQIRSALEFVELEGSK